MSELIQMPFGSISANNSNGVIWKISLAGPFAVAKCTDVLKDAYYTVPETPNPNNETFIDNNDIGFVISGAFRFDCPSHPEPVIHYAGELLNSLRYSEAHVMTALANTNSYVCLTTQANRTSIKKWNKEIIFVNQGIDAKVQPNINAEEEYLYVASGMATNQNGDFYNNGSLHNIKNALEISLSSNFPTYIIHIWG